MRAKILAELITKSCLVSMAIDLCKGVFNEILLKTTENDQKTPVKVSELLLKL